MAKGFEELKALWLQNTQGKGSTWKAKFSSEEARRDWADKLEAKFGVPASTILASGMGKKYAKAQESKQASDFDSMIDAKAAQRWADNLRRALTTG